MNDRAPRSGPRLEVAEPSDDATGVLTPPVVLPVRPDLAPDTSSGLGTQGADAALLLVELLSDEQVAGAALYRAEADGSLQLVGQHGLPADLASAWRSIPPSRRLPHIRCLQDGLPEYLSCGSPAGDDALPGTGAAFRSTAVLPIAEAGAAVGVVELLWAGPQVFDRTRTESLTRSVERVAPLLLRTADAGDRDLDWLHAVLHLQWHPWLLCEPVPGSTTDFVVVAAPLQIVPAASWVGRRISELWPTALDEGTLQAVAALMSTGGVWTTTINHPSDEPWGTPGTRVRVGRLGRRAVVLWRTDGARAIPAGPSPHAAAVDW